MEAVRKIVSVELLSSIVSLPWKKDTQVEIIVLPIEEQTMPFEYATVKEKKKLSDRFRGVLSEEAGKSFMEHTKKMREEWDSI